MTAASVAPSALKNENILAVGTGNPGKILSVKRTLSMYPALNSFEIISQAVDSGVSDQPSTLEETTTGATNRAKKAFDAVPGATLGIGMESGLFEEGDKMFDVCACAIWDGECRHVGYSCAWELPAVVQKLVKDKGLDLTQAFNEAGLCNDPKIGDKGGVIAILTGGRVNRPAYTMQSIQMALLAANPELNPCSASVPKGINDPPPESTGLAVLGAAAAAAVIAAVAYARCR